ncbi:MAG: T9SS type A sorting domain-containing protein [Ferruginibacter sp.]
MVNSHDKVSSKSVNLVSKVDYARSTDCLPPSIANSGQPIATQNICKGSVSSNLSVAATGDGLTYQWYADDNNSGYNGIALLSETSSIFTPPTNTSGTICYYVKITGTCGIATSDYANVHVNPVPSTVIMSPESGAICAGGSTILNAASAINYNWTIGTGNVSNVSTTPYKGYFGGSKSQQLYSKTELAAMGMTPGTPINKLSMNISAFSGPFTFNSFSIKMKNTASTTLTSTFETGATTVLGPINYTIPANSSPFVITHNLNSNFVWDGHSSILVEFCFNNNNGGAAAVNSANVVSSTASNMANYYSSDNNATVCSKTSGTLSSTRANMIFGYSETALITWSPSDGLNSNTGNAVTANPEETKIYTASCTNVFGCSSTNTATVNVSQALEVGAAINGPINACSYTGNSAPQAVYTIAAENAETITWTIPAGAFNVSGQGTNSISFNYPENFVSGDVSALLSPTAPCSATITRILNISKELPAAPVVSGLVNVCNFIGTGEELIYTVAPDENATSYLWTVGSMVTVVGDNVSSSLKVKLAPGFISSSSSKQLRVISKSACGNSAMSIFYLASQLPMTAGQITGPAEICAYVGTPNQATYQIADVTSAISYLWSLPVGASIIGANNGTSINVSFSNAFNGGYISVRAVNACGTSSARSLSVKRTLPSVPGLISGPNNICLLLPSIANPGGLPASYSVARKPNINYIWTVPAGVVIESHNNTLTDDIITVSFNNSYSGGFIKVAAEGECGLSAERVLSLSQLPTGAVSGILEYSPGTCKDRTYVYGVASMPTNSTSLEWTVPAGTTITSGQGTTTIAVLFPNDAIAGTITARANNGCGSGVNARTFAVKLGGCAPVEPMVKSNTKTSLPQELNDEQFDVKIYPNPSTSQFSLQLNSANKGKATMKILNTVGSKLSSNEIKPNETINFGSDLKAGFYFVEIIQGKNKKVIKIIKN